MPATPEGPLPNLLLAGFPKTGTTSLFSLLAMHPAIGASKVKETEYFLPARYGEQIAPVSEYSGLFAGTEQASIRMEATPAYVYGGAPLTAAVESLLGKPKVLFTVREPIARLRSYYRAQQARLRIPIDMTLGDYVAQCAPVGRDALSDRAQDPFLGVLGGMYSEFIPEWSRQFDVRVVAFEDLTTNTSGVLSALAEWLEIDPSPFVGMELPHENPSVLYRRKQLQRVALAINSSLEPLLRRHPEIKTKARAAYYRVNGRPMPKADGDIEADVLRLFKEANATLTGQLRELIVYKLPPWLADESLIDE